MKSLLLIASFLFVSLAYSQSKDCEFPKTFTVDKPNIVAIEWAKIDGKMSPDTIDYTDVKNQVQIPDSVTFENGIMTYFYSVNNEVTTKVGSYKVSDNKLTWRLDDEGSSYKSKWKKDDLKCMIYEFGINSSSSIETKKARTNVYYTLMPKLTK